MGSHKAWLISVVFLAGCAAGGKKGPSPFVLVEGRKVGTLEVIPEGDEEGNKKKRDSVAFDNRYLRTKPRIGFKYPGEEITQMKIYEGEKLLKSCDEGAFSRKVEKGGYSGGGWSAGSGGKMMKMPGTYTPDEEVYKQEYNLACEVAELKDGMMVELHDPEGMVARYKVVVPAQ